MTSSPLQVTVPESAAGQRLDAYAASLLEEQGLSRQRVKEFIKQGHILLAGKPAKPSVKLAGGDELTLDIPAPGNTLQAETSEDGDLPVIWSDTHLAVVNKPRISPCTRPLVWRPAPWCTACWHSFLNSRTPPRRTDPALSTAWTRIPPA